MSGIRVHGWLRRSPLPPPLLIWQSQHLSWGCRFRILSCGSAHGGRPLPLLSPDPAVKILSRTRQTEYFQQGACQHTKKTRERGKSLKDSFCVYLGIHVCVYVGRIWSEACFYLHICPGGEVVHGKVYRLTVRCCQYFSKESHNCS